MTINNALDHILKLKSELRKARKNLDELHNLSDELIDYEQAASSTDHPKSSQIQITLETAIQQLPEKQRIVFNLRYFEEMPYKQMSVVMGTSEGSLKASYHHAVKKIEQYLKLSYLDI